MPTDLAQRLAQAVLQCVRDSHTAWLAGDTQAALDCLDRALGLNPAQPDALRCQKGMIVLALGDWAQGWPLFELRWKLRGAAWHPAERACAAPRWQGTEPLEGRAILLHNEHGLGDGIMLARLARQLAARGARVLLEVQPALVELMRGLAGVSQVLPTGSAVTGFDFHCPLFSLPAALELRPQAVPDAGGYLRGDPARAAQWRSLLGERRRPRVGLAWSGQAANGNDRWRSIALEALTAALPEGIDYLGLQQQVRDTDVPALQAHPALRHFGPALHSMADTAALCEQVDLVVSVDTSVAHLAGALGKPVFLLLPGFGTDWRWLRGRDDSPWYPQARLFRGAVDGRWDLALERLEGAVAEMARAWS